MWPNFKDEIKQNTALKDKRVLLTMNTYHYSFLFVTIVGGKQIEFSFIFGMQIFDMNLSKI